MSTRSVVAAGFAKDISPDGILRSQLLEVFVRHDGRWLIEAFHNVDTKPPN